ncbi:acyl-CoA/acyl-ACP dehydrogenase [Tumebacillus sp. ITR2]|uniref:Acyl-CoA/acyl-ACP dehydrogenase n=1 Tax=Tumebacillus amylolyticus TaxID=2801339 RepID=A0ABS1JEH9_9BACL|nr:acyl-CoA dehydrogenase family protein [Tumebacillus amylolyticus]MBL0388664.1 acyl-CoA/acyl-ACP dehydrogenase [Tumebacillus amylolyticus]
MKQHLSSAQQELYSEFLTFVHEHVEPSANRWDIDQGIPHETISLCAARGYLGGTVPTEFGGQGWDYVTYGLFNEAIGRGSISLSGMFNVHTMVTETLCKWGTDDQQKFWLPKLASGEQVAALALTEPGAGSDLQMMKTNYRREGDTFILNGVKKWITFGAAADVLLVFGKLDGEQPIACLVHKDTPGLTITHIPDMLGFKASYLAMLEFDNVQVPVENMIGRPGFAISYLAPYALEFGRISIAWASLGLLRACVETCGAHVMDRAAFGANLIDHGMISHMITDMGVDLEAATLLCLEACRAKNEHRADATEKIMIAKYFASRAGARHSANAVQIMGALGCNDNHSVSRYYRDSKTMEIVEGSNQIHQLLLGKSFAKKAKRAVRK